MAAEEDPRCMDCTECNCHSPKEDFYTCDSGATEDDIKVIDPYDDACGKFQSLEAAHAEMY